MSLSLQAAASKVREAVRAAARGLVDRQVLVELVALAAVAREHVLVVGPPGTAKSQAVRNIAAQFQGRYFEYLLGRFTEPTDIFGSVDLGKLRRGEVHVQTAGMLPEADLAFLDEVFLGSTAILNTLLSILNERRFVRGHTRVDCPLRVCVGASNGLPDEASLAAFADRFLIRVFVESLPDELLESLLDAGWQGSTQEAPKASVQDLDTLAEAVPRVEMGEVRSELAEAVRLLRRAGITLSDRRVVKTQALLGAATVLRGTTKPSTADLWPLVYAVPTLEQQTLAREVLRDHLGDSKNTGLSAAAEEASASAAARAERLLSEANSLLNEATGETWSARAESVLREIDASLDESALPSDLKTARDALAARFGTAEA